ncbi:MAG: triacylglycerol lipase [Clostridiales bacterium]|nr:triacylglycerol lipase [Clostridiales bacterium]
MNTANEKRTSIDIINTVVLCLCANSFILAYRHHIFIPIMLILFAAVNIIPSFSRRYYPGKRLRLCGHGANCLRIFVRSLIISVIYHAVAGFWLMPQKWQLWLLSAAVCTAAEAVVFWNGMISVYAASLQLGVHHRLVGLLCGMVPVLNLIVLRRIVKVTEAEVDFEIKKVVLNQSREKEMICCTKYPLLMVHGVFFRDFRFFNYWGRIPDELIKNGAEVYYGEHRSAASVADSAQELTQRIESIVKESGCRKVNIIAHSKGGLDCRYAAAFLGADKYIASLTTVNTPHSGCEFADYLLAKVPDKSLKAIAEAYNGTLKKLGESEPDFEAAVKDLTASRCAELTAEMPKQVGFFCQSVGSKLNKAGGGKFPLNFTYPLVKYFDGSNDGLVSESAMRWGDRHIFCETNGVRGISHGDMIDLNRENISGFDVREFYVGLVSELREMGL